ncbi:hypothetical protein Poli38472_011775 [Pythium oligandrum]|uniref:Calcineurin-like phosphoesterase domain-containing protein n=1 Tax=Pythium oligandrum TaxID=41045 RepID=A0A8K1FFZ9_PYTOL|nr:hypothetical protein Poli38472_011775 [Pythium oligandrum]|eukprot:TMW58187.1 hypothetical protein Poli38472_011775 [Pythium oligandrum]
MRPSFAAAAALALAALSLRVDARFVVTDLRVVRATTHENALELCQQFSPSHFTTGIDWTSESTGVVVQLCQRREHVEDLKGSDRQVLRQIGVYPACPASMTEFYKPRDGVAVCTRLARADDVLPAFDYVSDVAVTVERNYNNDGPGWTTIPISLHGSQTFFQRLLAGSHRGVFLSHERPVVPITALEVLHNVAKDQAATWCSSLFGVQWQSAGTGFLDQNDDDKTVLCVQRDPNFVNAFAKLVDIAVVPTSQSCPEGFVLKQSLTSSVSLCSKWASLYANTVEDSVFVADIDLHRVDTANEDYSPTDREFLPGNFTLLYPEDLNAASSVRSADARAPVYLFSRLFVPQRFPSPPPLDKAPLNAVVNLYLDRQKDQQLLANRTTLSFKVLQLADLHYTGDPTHACRDKPVGMATCSEAVMTAFVNNLLDLEKPNFVVFSGDNVQTFSTVRRKPAMDAVMSGVEARKIPYAMVFGNHDDENGFPREEIVQIAMSGEHSYTQRGPVEVDGVGNYELSIKTPVDGPWGPAGTDIFRMYFLDSHAYPDTSKYPSVSASYDWVKPNQIAYYRQLSTAHGESPVPAIMFFHIPLLEYGTNAMSRLHGERYESVASSDVNTNLFNTLVERGEVKATFVGHDHVNEYCTLREGIQLCYGGGTGFGEAYGRSTFARRARVIEWSLTDSGERTIKSWKRHHDDLLHRYSEEVLFSETVADAQVA